MNTSEHVQLLASLMNSVANGQLQRALGSLGFLSDTERGQLCKQAGLSADQFREWLDGRWVPPVDQCLVLHQLALQRWRLQMGVELEGVSS